MAVIEGDWFREINDSWAGWVASLQIKQVLYHEKSKYQDILVFER